MKTNDNRVFRPPQVKLAAILLVLHLIFGFTKAIVHRPPLNLVAFGVTVGFLGLMVLWIWLIYRGANWARWIFVLWFTWSLFFSPWHTHWSLQEGRAQPIFGAVFFCVQTLLQFGAVALLFLPSSGRWFRSRLRTA